MKNAKQNKCIWKKTLRQNEGITLVALIITIILLIILAMITIKAITDYKIVELTVN